VKNRILLISVALLLAMSLVAIGCPPAEVEPVEPVKPVKPVEPPAVVFVLRMQANFPVGSSSYELFTNQLVPTLAERSGGRLIIEPFGHDVVVRSSVEAYDAVARGVLEAMITSSAFWVGKDPTHFFIRAALSHFVDCQQYEDWIWEGGGIDIARETYARGGLYYVGSLMQSAEPLHFTRRITSIAEFRGTKVRTPPGPTTALFAAIGGVPVALPAVEIYSALDKGIIDAAEWAGPADTFRLGLAEVTDYFLWPSFHSTIAPADVVVDMDVWKMLPDDLKVIFETTVREWSRMLRDMNVRENEKAIEKFLAAGDTQVFWPKEDWAIIHREIARILETEAAKSPLAAKAYQSQLDFARALGLL
jgi:TRAP-type mannitol/chloroaromatic compound transport system substrate-binding protein